MTKAKNIYKASNSVVNTARNKKYSSAKTVSSKVGTVEDDDGEGMISDEFA